MGTYPIVLSITTGPIVQSKNAAKMKIAWIFRDHFVSFLSPNIGNEIRTVMYPRCINHKTRNDVTPK